MGLVLVQADPPPAPVLTAIDPPCIAPGQGARWAVSGSDLDGVTSVLISGAGIEVTGKHQQDGRLALDVRAADGAAPGFRTLRVATASGLSNPKPFRVDPLPTFPLDRPCPTLAEARAIPFGAAVAGALAADERQVITFPGRAGQRVTIEVESRRLGATYSPTVTLLDPTGNPLDRTVPARALAFDGRLTRVLPRDGAYFLELLPAPGAADGPPTVYRVRIENALYATSLYPPGGPAGQRLTVDAVGGTLAAPRRFSVPLPDDPGTLLTPGPIPGPGGTIESPGRLAVGEGPEMVEIEGGPSGVVPLPPGTTANGRIGRGDEVDRYRVELTRGERVRIRVVAAVLGSALDSVVTLRDPRGAVVAENDDRRPPPGDPLAVERPSRADSLLDFVPAEDGPHVVEVADRYGAGGIDYAYRLEVGPVRADFAAVLLPAPDALNLRPGETRELPFVVLPEGRPGPIVVRAQGLPPGVTADPVTIRPSGTRTASYPGRLLLRADPDAGPALGALRVIATGRREDGRPLIRTATARVLLAPLPTVAPLRPNVLDLEELPVMVLAPVPAHSAPP